MGVIDFDLKCAFCCASLRGVDLDGACIFCGRKVRETLNLKVIDPATQTIVGDVSCIKCEYNLRTLRVHSVCPECATPVAASLDSTRLCFADVDFLNTVRSYATLMIVLLLSPLFVPVLAYIADAFLAVFIVVPFLFIPVVIGLCHQEIGHRYPWYLKQQTVITGSLALSVVILPFIGICTMDFWVGAFFVACVPLCLMFMQGYIALSIRHLAMRAQDRWLRCLSTALIAFSVVCFAWCALLFLLSSTPYGRHYAPVVIVSLWTGILVPYVLSLIVLVRFRQVLSRALKGRSETCARISGAQVYDGQARFAPREDERE